MEVTDHSRTPRSSVRSSVPKVFNYMTIELDDGEIVVLRQKDIRELYEGFGLTPPNIPRAIISMELRRAIAECGVAFIEHDADDSGVVRYITPSNIMNVRSHVFSADRYSEDECENYIKLYQSRYGTSDISMTPNPTPSED